MTSPARADHRTTRQSSLLPRRVQCDRAAGCVCVGPRTARGSSRSSPARLALASPRSGVLLELTFLSPYHLPRIQDAIEQLYKRFPGSPRTVVLEGMLLEARGLETEARAHYERMLAVDETSIVSTTQTHPLTDQPDPQVCDNMRFG